MADPRFRSTEEPRDDYQGLSDRPSYGARDQGYSSSARDYEAAGMIGESRTRSDSYRDNDRGGYRSDERSDYGNGYRGGGTYRARGGDDWGRGQGDRSMSDWGRGQGDRAMSGRGARDDDNRGMRTGNDRSQRDQDRGFLDRAGDEIRSWFGDEEAERRRDRDMRQSDRDYHDWRARQVADLDRDYDEYRRENAQRFDNEFGAWRTERQSQRSSLERVQEHMEVVGTDGEHVGTVDKVRGDRIILTKSDTDASGHHHSIPSRWIESVNDKVMIRKTADQAKAHWRDEERSGALFGDSENRSSAGHPGKSWSAI